MKLQICPILAFVIFIVSVSVSGTELLVYRVKKTFYNVPKSCPRGYKLAKLNTNELWKEAVALTLKVMGYDQRIWIRQGLNWTGAGNEEWMIITPTNPKTCIFPPENLQSFCVPNERGKLAVNSNKGRKLYSLCMKV